MNVAFFLVPKANVEYLYDDYTVRQGLEKMRCHGYTAIPVIDREGKYISTISEGDFLWGLVDFHEGVESATARSMEKVSLKRFLKKDKNPPVKITASVNELLQQAMNQNFIPVIDDTGVFMGIVTRRDIMKYYYEGMKKE